MDNPRCDRCVYWERGWHWQQDELGPVSFGFCYRMPHRIQTDDGHWCGEFKQRPDE